jgi:hypothetical protein
MKIVRFVAPCRHRHQPTKRHGRAVTLTADIQMMESSKITSICFGTDNEHSDFIRRNKPWRLNTDEQARYYGMRSIQIYGLSLNTFLNVQFHYLF